MMFLQECWNNYFIFYSRRNNVIYFLKEEFLIKIYLNIIPNAPSSLCCRLPIDPFRLWCLNLRFCTFPSILNAKHKIILTSVNFPLIPFDFYGGTKINK